MSRWIPIVLALAACSRASDDSKKWQEQAPPKEAVVPAGLAIAVDVDGTARAPITAHMLESIKPDFVEAERRAWLIATLVTDASPAGTQVEATTPTGISMKLSHPTSDGLEPVLFLTRRGELILSAVDPKDPFPNYHGQGGRLHRSGDSMPRISPVAKLAITRAK